MTDQIELPARIRARAGTNRVRRLRREGDVPAVLYGAGKPALSIAINHNLLFHQLERPEFHSAIITINTDGEKEQAILRTVQRHPYKSNVLHADFQRIEASRQLVMSVPLNFLGEEECRGVKEDGGVLTRMMYEVEISCLPKDLPESLSLNVADLGMNDSLHLSDIALPEGVIIPTLAHDDTHEHDHAVIAVVPPKIAEIEEPEETEGEEGEEGEAAEGEGEGDTKAEGKEKESSGDDGAGKEG